MTSLNEDSHVDVMVVLQGIGEKSPFSGPVGETLEVTVVPEFGSMVVMILTLAVIATIDLQKSHKVKNLG